MAWYAYCITEQQTFGSMRARRPFPIEELIGIGGHQVFAYPSGELAVIVSEYVKTDKLTQKAVVEHAHVVSSCFRNNTVLPFRFGTIFESDEALRRAVRANRKAFVESVGRLRGKAEMHLKLMVKDGMVRTADDGALPHSVGSEYLVKLQAKAARERERQTKARAISVQIHKLFNPLEEEVTCRSIDSGGLMIDIAHLIDHKSIEKYQNRFNSATRQIKNVEIALSGPWPPYHFTPTKIKTVS